MVSGSPHGTGGRQLQMSVGTGITEYYFNNRLVDKVSKELRFRGVDTVVIRRDTYPDLPSKVNDYGVSFSVSFHSNAYDEEASGTEVLYYHSSKASRSLANSLNTAICNSLGLPNRGIKGINGRARGGYLLKNTYGPCVISEPFFIDNNIDLGIAIANFDNLADAYVHGILEFMRLDN